jgi:Na+/proline symporter
LSARGQRDAARALVTSGVVVFLQFALFLGIGVLLAAFHHLGGEAAPACPDEVFATFIIRHFPADTGLIGVLLAAILAAAMSTIASSLNASASSMIHDLWLPLRGASGRSPPLFAEAALGLTRQLTVAFGLVQIAVGVAAARFDATVVSRALTIAGYSSGLLLGVFALGVATRRVGQQAALLGAAAGLVALLTVQFVLPAQGVRIAWPWYALIGATVTIVAGIAASAVFPRRTDG